MRFIDEHIIPMDNWVLFSRGLLKHYPLEGWRIWDICPPAPILHRLRAASYSCNSLVFIHLSSVRTKLEAENPGTCTKRGHLHMMMTNRWWGATTSASGIPVWDLADLKPSEASPDTLKQSWGLSSLPLCPLKCISPSFVPLPAPLKLAYQFLESSDGI